MTRKTMNKLLVFTMVALLAVAMLSSCENTNGDSPSPGTSPVQLETTKLGEGAVSFAFEVTDDTGTVTKYEISTDEETVGAALLAVGLIEGDNGEFGLMVTTVNGKRADYTADGAYWAFYEGGGYAAAGVDTTAIDPNQSYAFVYTKA